MDQEGKSRGKGFVEFERHEDAERAIRDFDGVDFKGRNIKVCMENERSGFGVSNQDSNKKTRVSSRENEVVLRVSNLSNETRWQALKDHFKDALGMEVKFARIDTHGSGFVHVIDQTAATRAVKDLDGSNLDGNAIFVSFDEQQSSPRPREDIHPSYRQNQPVSRSYANNHTPHQSVLHDPRDTPPVVYVDDLPTDFTWQNLKDFFKDSGFSVKHTEMFIDSTGKPKGSGMAVFRSREDAHDAISYANEQRIDGKLLRASLG